MNFLPSLLDWHAANAPTSLPKEIPYEEKKQDDGYISVMDPARPPEVESVSELLVRKINDIWQGMKDPGKVVNFLAREAIDPLNYLPSAPAKAAAVTAGSAGILAALMKFGTVAPSKAASMGNQAGAFRPSASRLLPSSLIDLSQSLHGSLGYRKTETRDNMEGIADLILDKTITSKELTKYGAPEFQLDPYLLHVRTPGRIHKSYLPTELPLRDFLKADQERRWSIRGIMDSNKRRADLVKDNSELGETDLGDVERTLINFLNKDLQFGNRGSPKVYMLADDARAYMGQLKDKKPIYEIDSSIKRDAAKLDILAGTDNVARILDSAGYTPEQLSKKTLQQLVGIAQKEEKELLARQAKSAEALTEHTVRRTVELQTKQQLPPESKGLVQLENEKDLATETAFQNICCGAGRVDQSTMKYVPAWDPITGKREPGLGTVPVSGDNFFGRVKSGESLMFSYRPNGIPEATIELNAKTGSIREIAGKNNAPMDPKLKDAVLKALAPVQRDIVAIKRKNLPDLGLFPGTNIRRRDNEDVNFNIEGFIRWANEDPQNAEYYMRQARELADHVGRFDEFGMAIND